MDVYHVTNNSNVEQCRFPNHCEFNSKSHFKSFTDAVKHLGKVVCFEYSAVNSQYKYKSVKRFNSLINYNSGMTIHYKENRIYREKELTRLLGRGKPIAAFIVDEGDGNLQIQEVLDNAIINVYSFKTHKKITLFAPHPNRICLLYEVAGELAPEYLLLKSEENAKNGYNRIHYLE